MLAAALDIAAYALRLPAPNVPQPSPPRSSWLLGHYPDMQAALADGSFFGLITHWARTHAPRGATYLAVPGGERWVIVASDSCVAAIYRDPDGIFGKTVAWMDATSELAPLSLVPSEGGSWRRHRKLIAHAFSFRHLALAVTQGDVSCRRLLRGFAAGAQLDAESGGRVAAFDAAECFHAVFLDVQGVCNLRADFGGVSHFLASHGYPSGLGAGEADPLAVEGVSRVAPATGPEAAEAAPGMLAAANEFSGLLQRLFLSPKPLWRVSLPWGALARVAELREYMRGVARGVLEARRASGGGSDAAISPGAFTDLADMLLAAEVGGASDPGGDGTPDASAEPASAGRRRGDGGLSAAEVVDDTVALMWAATETSGATLGWLVYLICADTDASLTPPKGTVRCFEDLLAPEAARSAVRTKADVAAGTLPPPPAVDGVRPAAPLVPGPVWTRLTEEVGRVLGLDPSGPLPPEALDACPYLRAVVDETLRLCPIGSNARRVLRDADVAGVQFCAGDMVLIPMGCLHYDGELWGPRVGEFAPERWLPNPPPDLALPRNLSGAYFPFGGGVIGCPGSRFALVQMRAALVRLVQTFSCLRLARDAPPVRILQKLVATARDGIQVEGLLRQRA